MKRCPSCQRNYPDDAPDYCANDGMRLLREEAATFDPEKTVTATGTRAAASAPQAPPAIEPQQQQYPAPPPPVQTPAPSLLQPPSPGDQQQQQWAPPQAGGQLAQQAWPSTPPPAAQQSPLAWGDHLQQSPSNAPYGVQYAQGPPLRRRALATASIVFGVAAGTLMALTIAGNNPNFRYYLMLFLSILSIVLGIGALFLAIKKSARFGGVELAIAGLALGVAGLVYALLNQTW